MNMDMVRPNRSSVYFLDRRAMVSRYGSAAGESRAMKSFTSQWLLANARRTSVSFIREIRSVVSSQLIFSNSSENIFFLSIYIRYNGDASHGIRDSMVRHTPRLEQGMKAYSCSSVMLGWSPHKAHSASC